MRRDIDELDVEFNFQAKEAYYSLYARFTNVARALNREKDEQVFQSTRVQYSHAMKAQLEKIALSVIQQNQGMSDENQLRRNLSNIINDYLKEFMMKSQSV